MPPLWPEIRITSALALATPAAMVPMPERATSFTRDPRLGVDLLQVVDELRQILDRVDVVMRRRADQRHAGRRVAQLGDHLADLEAGQLAALAGLGALGDLDLELAAVVQILGRDAEAARGDLLDGRGGVVAVGPRLVARRDPRRLRRSRTWRRCGSWRSTASRAPRGRARPARCRARPGACGAR